jgi:hypothetical protein
MAVALILLPAGVLRATEQTAEPIVSLRWALGAVETEDGRPSAIRRDTQIKDGSRLKFLVDPLSPGSVYLILLDSENAIHVLYQETTHMSDGTDGKPTYIPPGARWFEAEGAGLDTFFILASVEPLSGLDALLARHESAAGGARQELGTQIVAEIRRLHREHRSFSRPVERPAVIGGATRSDGGATAAIDRLAVEVSAERFYGKTITIEH